MLLTMNTKEFYHKVGEKSRDWWSERMNRDKFMSVEDVAREFGMNVNTIYRELRLNHIPHVRVGDRYIIPREAFERWLQCRPKESLDA